MSLPNPQYPGETVLLTRRTSQRQFLLRPDATMVAIFGYLLALYASQHRQLVSAVCVLSNHWHAILTDNFWGKYSLRWKLLRDLHGNVARARNPDLGRTENLWSSSKPGNTSLLDRDAVIRELVYTWVQPVAAHLVERAADWPGLLLLPSDWGKELVFERPDLKFFRKKFWPESLTLVPMPPPCLQDIPLEEAVALCEWLIAAEEERWAAERAKTGRTVLGAEAAVAVDPFSSPNTPAPNGNLNPRLASRDQNVLKLAKTMLRQWRDTHISARCRHRDGTKNVVFPAGTIAARVYQGRRIARLPPEHPALWQRRLPHCRASAG